MPIDPTNSVTTAPAVSESGQRATGSALLGKDDFLRLLVGQLQNQDPLNPTDSSEYMGQLTQFAILEQITNLNQTLSAAASNDYDAHAVSLIGKEISYLRVVDGELKTFTGRVESVTFTRNGPQLVVSGDDEPVLPVSVVNVWGPDGPPTDPPADEGGAAPEEAA